MNDLALSSHCFDRRLAALIGEALISFLAEKGGSRTLRGPYDPQTGFEDQRHHRAPSFSLKSINDLIAVNRSSVTISVAICEAPKAIRESSASFNRTRAILTLRSFISVISNSTRAATLLMF